MFRSLIILFCCVLPLCAQESAQSIVEKADQLMRGETHTGLYRMTIIRPDWQRSLEFKLWSKGTEKSFILILEPAKERGVTFLKLSGEMWNYIPKINREIKIPPSMMMQSWMGSDFTNDDLVKESDIVKDYHHTLLGKENVRDWPAYKIELQPKPQAAVVWDRIIEWIRIEDYIPLKAEYYNERGELVRTLLFKEIQEMGGRTIPTKIELVEEKKSGHKTVMTLKQASFNEPIPPSVFTRQHLRRARP